MRISPATVPLLASMLFAAAGLAGCATGGAPVDVTGAEVAVRDLGNGDTLEEYRVAGQLRVVKITPARGPVYYLVDKNGDGVLDSSKGEGNITPVQYKLFSW